jgi:hypothetical protein
VTPWVAAGSRRVFPAFNASNVLGVLGVLLASGVGLDAALATSCARHAAAGKDATTGRRLAAAS